MPDTAAALLSPAESGEVDPARTRATKSRTPGEAADSTGKRKRLASSAPPKDAADSPQTPTADDAPIDPAVKASIVAGIMKNMLVVLTQHDPTPSILHHELEAGRPSKRAKSNHNSPRPLTIAQQLAQGTYTDFASLLDDIYSVASAITAKVRAAAEKRDAGLSNGPEEVPLVLAKVLLFQQMAHNLATVEQARRPGIFDQDIPPAPQLATTQKVCLTIMSQNGPLFSSLQKPTTVSTAVSAVSTPAASPSTAPTSLNSSPLKNRNAPATEVAVVQPIPESVLPVAISATKIIAQQPKATSNTPSVPVKTFGENFAPPPHLRPIGPPVKGGSNRNGMSWGGKINGSLPPPILNEAQTRTGLWLSYKNDTPDTRGRSGQVVGANALPKEFVAAYTSFAPTSDDSAAGVPSSVKQMVWWAKIGKSKFTRLFPEFDNSGSMVVGEEDAVGADDDAMDVDEKVNETNEEELFKEAVEKYQPEEPPIDFRLLNGDWEKEPDQTADFASLESSNQEKLDRISSLLESLYKQQHIRLATAPPAPPRAAAGASPSPAPAAPLLGTATQPSDLEVMLYNDAVKELTKLISELPPHVVAAAYGDKDGESILSSIIPMTNGSEVWKGTLPSSSPVKRPQPMNGYPVQSPRVPHHQQVVGIPQNGIPPPQMHQMQPVPQHYQPQPVRVPVNVPAPPPPSQQQHYHSSRMPQQHQMPQTYPQLYHTHSYPGQQAPTPQRMQTPVQQTPHYLQGIQPPPPRIIGPIQPQQQQQQQQYQQMPQQQHQQQQQMHRGMNVPPPQGLAAVGYGVPVP
ncbi:hypothetical protein DFH27DRAFT_503952, partial [Peziza echinospora]